VSRPTYTDEDVTEIVEASKVMLNIHAASIAPAMRGRLKRALAPFQPDPDEALIEAIAQEVYNLHRQPHWSTWEATSESGRRMSYDTARAALAAYRAHEGGGK